MSEDSTPLWTDPDDHISDKDGIKIKHPRYEARPNTEYRQRLVEKFEQIHGKPSWACASVKRPNTKDDLEDSEEESGDDETIKSGDSERMSKKKVRSTERRSRLNFLRLKNLNVDADGKTNASTDIIRSIKFHPNQPVALVADSKDRIGFYKVDLEHRSRITSFGVKGFSLRDSNFSVDGKEVYISSGLQSHFWVYDITSGKLSKINPDKFRKNDTIRKLIPGPENDVLVGLGHQGQIHILSRHSKELMHTFHQNEGVEAVTFDESGRLICVNSAGIIQTYDIKQKRCLSSVSDHASYGVSSVTHAKVGKTLALGTRSGVVRIRQSEHEVTVSKEIKNLTTSITSMETNHTGELIGFASNESQNAIRLFDVRGLNVVPEFPGKDFVGRANCLDFSPSSGFFSFGNNRGQAYLYRLGNYENY